MLKDQHNADNVTDGCGCLIVILSLAAGIALIIFATLHGIAAILKAV